MKNGKKDGNAKQVPASFNRAKDVSGFKKGGGVKAAEPVVKKSFSDNGAAVKKIPLKLAAGGVAKERKGFPGAKK